MKVEEVRKLRVLISPLNWGFGHVSRCIPLISQLLDQGNVLFIACNEPQKQIFLNYFNETSVKFIQHEGYPFQFSGNGNFAKDLFFSLRLLKIRSRSELSEVEKMVQSYQINLIISDHRYTFRSEKCKTVFMTHQLNLPIRWFQFPFKIFHKTQISKFDFIWLVDDVTKRLAGKLATINNQKNVIYIGIRSRFKLYQKLDYKVDNVLIISGPKEYWQTLFELFRNEITSGEINKILGPKEISSTIQQLKLRQEFVSSEDWLESDKVLLKAKKIYGYFGYTTLMDVEELGCDSHLLPCPGQLEQIYLATK